MRKSMKVALLVVTLLFVLTLASCSAGDNPPIYDQPIGVDQGVGWVQWIVSQISQLVYTVSAAAGGHYIVGLIVITLAVRIAGWPIYSKSTAMSANMQIAQPELERLKEKYQGKNDEASRRAMQQEMMVIYKKYNINPLGCLFPLLQMPIFIAMYQVVRRIPLTPEFTEDLNFEFLIFDFTATPTASILNVGSWFQGNNWQFLLGAALVGLTMYFYQQYAMKKPEYLQNKKYKSDQQAQTEKMMKFMTYFMVIMLTSIAYTSLGIAFYWIIGNLFQFFQTHVNRKQTYKKYFADKETVK